ncbi:glycerophosphodiester phosphodiesterase family protein [Lutibacter sp. TH_r2]|uniref:glycerophosphodiester phosphodiesterase family protein n=1 Tax=Lutibacter sp. TH_r2 TaxID=3082083 RepID=UPI002954B30F|nr:glycerophosphodiester phosphodiesterase family protein [Lutibacter sp. TH_r2]MDV7185826.1 glycerophosphodiester phosphodiesterase family protein [Lutibacter sp. TH_r2]
MSLNKALVGALAVLCLGFVACEDDTKDYNEYNYYEDIELGELSAEAKQVRDYVMDDAIIAHRGSTFWAPEETEAAFRWARNMGADYLELDLQRTEDGFLLALHDGNLRRTSNIESVFPGSEDLPVSAFTLAELRELDAGSWFNEDEPENARSSFENQKICTLEEVLMIAQGYRIKRDSDGNPVKLNDGADWKGLYEMELDPLDNGNRPGIYAETKEPYLFGGMEDDLAEFLTEQGWNINSPGTLLEAPSGDEGKVAYTNGRFILQSFSRESIVKLETALPGIPKCMLLWLSESSGYVRPSNTLESLAEFINFSVEYNCHIAGPSIAGSPNYYDDLTEPWMNEMYHRAGMIVHAYSFDTEDQLRKYNGDYYYGGVSRFDDPDREVVGDYSYDVNENMFIDGGFTNLTDLSLEYYGRGANKTAQEVLDELGY